MLSNKDIKEHEIKLTSSEILNAYENHKEIKKKRFNFRIIAPLGFLAAILLLVIIIPKNFNKSNNHNSTSSRQQPAFKILKNQDESNRLGFSIVSSILLINEDNLNVNKVDLHKKNNDQDITNEDFNNIVNQYENVEELVDYQVNNKFNLNVEFTPCTYVNIHGKSFSYKYEYSDLNTIIYIDYEDKNHIDEEKNFVGEIISNNLTYSLKGSIEEVDFEREVEIKIDYNQYQIKLEEEFDKQKNEYSYEYTKIINDEEIFKFEYEKEKDIELKLLENNMSYKFKVLSHHENTTNIEYKFENELNSKEIKSEFVLNKYSTYKEYIDEKNNLKIIKNYQ